MFFSVRHIRFQPPSLALPPRTPRDAYPYGVTISDVYTYAFASADVARQRMRPDDESRMHSSQRSADSQVTVDEILK